MIHNSSMTVIGDMEDSDQGLAPVSKNFVSDLLYGISHDLGAPLRHVVQMSQMVSGDNLSEKDAKWLRMTTESGQRAQHMVRSLVELSRLSTRCGDLASMESSAIIDDCKQSLSSKLSKPNVFLSCSQELPVIEGYWPHWRTLTYCLLENGLVFQPLDSESTTEVSISFETDADNIYLTVEDNGIGINDSQFDVISRPFKRLNRIDEYPGLGMGLTYCQYIAELNNGILSFKQSSMGGLQVCYRQPRKHLT